MSFEYEDRFSGKDSLISQAEISRKDSVKQKWTTLDYELLSEYTSEKCMVYSLSIPNTKGPEIYNVSSLNGSLNCVAKSTDLNKIVNFDITYIPFTESAGELIGLVKQKVEDVIKKSDYQPKPATINIYQSNNQDAPDSTIMINDVFITQGEVYIKHGQTIFIKYYLSGLIG